MSLRCRSRYFPAGQLKNGWNANAIFSRAQKSHSFNIHEFLRRLFTVLNFLSKEQAFILPKIFPFEIQSVSTWRERDFVHGNIKIDPNKCIL